LVSGTEMNRETSCVPVSVPAHEAPAMKFPRVRFTVRQIMFAVAFVAFATHSAIQSRKCLLAWDRFRGRAELYASFESELRQAVDGRHELAGCHYRLSKPPPLLPDRLKYLSELSSHYCRLKRKYQRAMLQPWASVPPDPIDWIPGDGPDPVEP
jgi:hypothetical protein